MNLNTLKAQAKLHETPRIALVFSQAASRDSSIANFIMGTRRGPFVITTEATGLDEKGFVFGRIDTFPVKWCLLENKREAVGSSADSTAGNGMLVATTAGFNR